MQIAAFKPMAAAPAFTLAAVLVLAGCATTDEYGNPRSATETEKGLGIGAAIGPICPVRGCSGRSATSPSRARSRSGSSRP